MSDDIEFRSAGSDTIEIVYEEVVYPLAAAMLVCECGGHHRHNGFVSTTEVEGVRALGLGTTCRECGEETLHIAYPGEPA